MYAHRGTVIEFATIEWANGDLEWKNRVISVTQDPQVTSASLGRDLDARLQRIADDYDHVVATSRAPICRYGVSWVVARADVHAGPWLRPVYRNPAWALYQVRPGTCAGTSSKPNSLPVRKGTT
jgi:hypothetical protein